jgi:4-carboxymuconolactone decarboxylase
MEQSREEQGYEVLRRLLPDSAGAVPEREGMPSTIDDLGRLVIEHVFADSWARPGLDLRTKSFLTLGFLIAQGSGHALERNFHAALNLGITKEELVEVLIHALAYCGGPRTNEATSVAMGVFAQRP